MQEERREERTLFGRAELDRGAVCVHGKRPKHLECRFGPAQPLKPILSAPADRLHHMTGLGLVIRCTTEETGGEAVVVEVFLPAGEWRTLGDSTAQERRFEVVQGELSFRTDGGTHVVGPGERFTVPAGSTYRLRSTGSRPAQFVCEIRPALDFEERVGALFTNQRRST
jgi:mannose-6-phosphate isomerase-like protein (cupin superfamily)